MRRDANPTAEINDRLPIIPHESLGTDCCGCLFVLVKGGQADIVCNECRAVIRTVRVGDVQSVMSEMAQTDVSSSTRCTQASTG